MMNYLKLGLSLLILNLALLSVSFDYSMAQDPGKKDVRIVMRGDDMGISYAVNLAILESFNNGIQKSVEVIIPGPWFPHAAKLLNDTPGIDVGVHLALSSEWNYVKWGPLTNSPSLTDSLGYFFPGFWSNEPNKGLLTQDWKIQEVEQEFRKQIEVAQANLPNVTHLTYHMGSNGISPEVTTLAKELAIEYGLDIDIEELGVKKMQFAPRPETSEQKIQQFIRILRELPPGDHMYVAHPGLEAPETAAMAQSRYDILTTDFDLLTSERVMGVIKELGIDVINYTDL